MKKSINRIITIAALCFFIVVCIFVGADIVKSRQSSLQQAGSSLSYMSENCADEFSAIFDNADMMVNDISSIVEETILVSQVLAESRKGDESLEQLRTLVSQITAHSKYPISIYLTFNPEYFREDIWYVKGLDDEVRDLSVNGEAIEEWLKEWNDEKYNYESFFRDSVEAGDMWYEAGYDPDIQWEVVSRTKAVYDKEDRLIGIVGADVYLGDISGRLEGIDEKTGGESAVLNSDGVIIAGDSITAAEDRSGDWIYAESAIGDLWTVVLRQPVSVAVGSMGKTIVSTVIIGAMIGLVLVLIIAFAYRKHAKPIIREFEEKDVLLINQARQAQLGEMVGNIAHQLKQPLNGVNMALSNLSEDYGRDMPPDEQNEFEARIARIKSRISGMSDTVDDFMHFLRPEKEKCSFSVKEAIQGVMTMMEESLHIDAIRSEITGEDFCIRGYKNEFAQCIFNLLDNARDAVRNRADRLITIRLDKEEKDRLGRISVINNGEAIDGELIERIFELYFTTKENSGGTGIGLYMTRGIIEEHFGGRIECENISGGVCFSIFIPMAVEENDDRGKQHG